MPSHNRLLRLSRLLMAGIGLWALVSLACSLPNLSLGKKTPQATTAPSSTQASIPLPVATSQAANSTPSSPSAISTSQSNNQSGSAQQSTQNGNLLHQPPAGEGLLPWLRAWKIWLQPGSVIAGHNSVTTINDPLYEKVFVFSRTKGGGDGGGAGLEIRPNLDVSKYPHLYVSILAKVDEERGGNIANVHPQWYPEGAVQIRIWYHTADGKKAQWFHGFYHATSGQPDTAHFTKVPLHKWFSWNSEDLMALPNPPALIDRVLVHGFGWGFKGEVASVELIGAQQPASGSSQGLQSQGGTAEGTSPSPTPPPTLVPTPTAIASLPEERIMFAPGATHWETALEAINQSFVFNGKKWQPTEIFVAFKDRDKAKGEPTPQVALAITAPDGTPLQTFEEGRTSWRGMLPQDGDYHIKVQASPPDNLRIVVNSYPLPQPPQRVVNDDLGFSLIYDNKYFQQVSPQQGEHEALRLKLIYAPFFKKTNLIEAYFYIKTNPGVGRDECLEKSQIDTPTYGNFYLWNNGQKYHFFDGGEPAAGNIYDVEDFQTFAQGRCVSVVFFIHSGNIDAYDPSSDIKEFDWDAVWGAMMRVFLTLKWR